MGRPSSRDWWPYTKCVTVEAEREGLGLKPRDARAPRSRQRREGAPGEPPEEAGPAAPRCGTSSSRAREPGFCCSQRPRLWSFATATRALSHPLRASKRWPECRPSPGQASSPPAVGLAGPAPTRVLAAWPGAAGAGGPGPGPGAGGMRVPLPAPGAGAHAGQREADLRAAGTTFPGWPAAPWTPAGIWGQSLRRCGRGRDGLCPRVPGQLEQSPTLGIQWPRAAGRVLPASTTFWGLQTITPGL